MRRPALFHTRFDVALGLGFGRCPVGVPNFEHDLELGVLARRTVGLAVDHDAALVVVVAVVFQRVVAAVALLQPFELPVELRVGSVASLGMAGRQPEQLMLVVLLVATEDWLLVLVERLVAAVVGQAGLVMSDQRMAAVTGLVLTDQWMEVVARLVLADWRVAGRVMLESLFEMTTFSTAVAMDQQRTFPKLLDVVSDLLEDAHHLLRHCSLRSVPDEEILDDMRASCPPVTRGKYFLTRNFTLLVCAPFCFIFLFNHYFGNSLSFFKVTYAL